VAGFAKLHPGLQEGSNYQFPGLPSCGEEGCSGHRHRHQLTPLLQPHCKYCIDFLLKKSMFDSKTSVSYKNKNKLFITNRIFKFNARNFGSRSYTLTTGTDC